MKATDMTEPASSAAAGFAAASKFGLFAKLGALLGVGTIGGLLVAAIDPVDHEPDPKKRRRILMLQGMVAGMFSVTCTPATVRWLDSWLSWINLAGAASFEDWASTALPVAMLLGCLSWGLLGMLIKLRALIRDRGAQAVAEKAGLKDEAPHP